MKKILLVLSLSLFSLTASAASINEVVQNFPIQLTSDDQSVPANSNGQIQMGDNGNDNIDNNTFVYNAAYSRVMNENMQASLTPQGKNTNTYMNALYAFAGMAFTGQGTSLNDNVASRIKGGFSLSQGERKYLYQEQANIYNMVQKGSSPAQVKSYIDSTSRKVLSGAQKRGSVGINTNPDTPDLETSAPVSNNNSGSGSNSSSSSGSGFKFNY